MIAANPFSGLLKISDKPAPMAALMPWVVSELQCLTVGQGLELPPTKRRCCHWSHDINGYAKRAGIALHVSQTTVAGITTAWRVL